jgi:hypothetical protein
MAEWNGCTYLDSCLHRLLDLTVQLQQSCCIKERHLVGPLDYVMDRIGALAYSCM